MRIKIICLVVLYLFLQNSAIAQLLELQPKLLSLRNARISFGIGGDINYSFDNDSSFMNNFIGSLPDSYEINYHEDISPIKTYSVFFDLYSPNSRIGILFGGNYNLTHIRFAETNVPQPGAYYNLSIERVEIPVYLKFKTGKIHTKANGIFLAGASYAIPFKYKIESNASVISDKNSLARTLSFHLGAGVQYNFGKKDEITNTDPNKISMEEALRISYPRIWVYYKGSYLYNNLFETSQSTQIFPTFSNSSIDYRDINHTIGVSIFFGSRYTQ